MWCSSPLALCDACVQQQSETEERAWRSGRPPDCLQIKTISTVQEVAIISSFIRAGGLQAHTMRPMPFLRLHSLLYTWASTSHHPHPKHSRHSLHTGVSARLCLHGNMLPCECVRLWLSFCRGSGADGVSHPLQQNHANFHSPLLLLFSLEQCFSEAT